MKIIDLYDMVAKGEQPKKFKYKDRWFAYSVDDKEFRTLKQEVYNGDYPEYIYLSELIDLSNLNDEIEIIGEQKKIEKLNLDKDELLKNVIITAQDYVIEGKINEIIDYINKGDSNE